MLLFIIFKCILYAIRFLCEVNPEEQRKLHAHNSQPSCNYSTYGKWERGTDRHTDNPDVRQCLNRQLTLFANRYKSTTILIKYKEFDIALSTDFVMHQCCYELLISRHTHTHTHIYIYIYCLTLHESSLKSSKIIMCLILDGHFLSSSVDAINNAKSGQNTHINNNTKEDTIPQPHPPSPKAQAFVGKITESKWVI